MITWIRKSTKPDFGGPQDEPFIRIHPLNTYVSADLGMRFGAKRIYIGIDADKGIILMVPSAGDDGFLISDVCDANKPWRIELPNVCITLLKNGFPPELLGRRLPAFIDDCGFIRCDFLKAKPADLLDCEQEATT